MPCRVEDKHTRVHPNEALSRGRLLASIIPHRRNHFYINTSIIQLKYIASYKKDLGETYFVNKKKELSIYLLTENLTSHLSKFRPLDML